MQQGIFGVGDPPFSRTLTAGPPLLRVVPGVFFPAAFAVVALVGLVAFRPDLVGYFLELTTWIVETVGWFFSVSVSFFLMFCVYLGVSRYGSTRLGPDDARPEYPTLSWLAMLFSAGMGIGLMFFSVAEPMLHYGAPPSGDAHTADAARIAMGVTLFHWGIHAWAIYGVVGLSLAYFAYRHGLALTIRSAFKPLLGRYVEGAFGHLVDLLAVFGTLFGLATSLGLGAKQINAGLSHVLGIENSEAAQIVIIVLVTLTATASLVSGVSRGIRRLSELNLCLALLLLLAVFACGPTLFIADQLPWDIAAFVRHAGAALVFADEAGSTQWQADWTVFYWAWWISWAPFVGTFVARISRGRTVREFLLGVLVGPTVLTVLWLVTFGETATYLERFREGGIARAVADDSAVAIFRMLEQLPAASFTTALAVVVVILFFVTSSDSGSFVVDMLTSGGQKDPPVGQRIFWALTEGAIAIVLLVAGGLKALQSAAIATGLPFCVVMLVMCFSLLRALRRDRSLERSLKVPSEAPASAAAAQRARSS